MRRFLVLNVLVLFSSIILGESLTTKEFGDIEPAITKFAATVKGTKVKGKPEQKNIVVAFDYDDTLLSAVSVIGGEGWFTWQEDLLKNKTAEKNSDLLADNFDDLLLLQSRLLGLIRFKPTEASIPGALKSLVDKGYSVIVCTSRGYGEYAPTVRELKINGIDLKNSPFANANHTYAPFLPYDLKAMKKVGMTDQDAKEFKLKAATPVVFTDGVYLTEGQNKGVMLRSLLHRSKLKVHGLVFVDNRKKHVERVEKAFAPIKKTTALFTVLYNRVDTDNQPLANEEKKVEQARNEYEQLRNFIN